MKYFGKEIHEFVTYPEIGRFVRVSSGISDILRVEHCGQYFFSTILPAQEIDVLFTFKLFLATKTMIKSMVFLIKMDL